MKELVNSLTSETLLSTSSVAQKEAKNPTWIRSTIEKVPLDVLGLSYRARSRLRLANIDSVGQLLDCTWTDLYSIWHLGHKTALEIADKLDSFLCSPASAESYVQPLPAISYKRSYELEPYTLTFSSALKHFLERLEPKQVTVLKLRFGLEDGQRRTLEEIGLEFELTRERIRQIQTKALRRLLHPSRKKYLDVMSVVLENIIREAGGVLPEREIGRRLTETIYIGNFHPAGLSRFILQLSSKFIEVGDEAWALVEYPLKHMYTVIENAVRLLEAHRSRMRFNTLVSEIKRVSCTAEAAPVLDSLFIEACIKACPEVEVMSGGWCSLTKWQTRYLDETIQVLRDEGKSLHFRVIASRVNDLLGNERGRKQVADHSVHALLLREGTIFARVGPGTYGLREWGIKSPPYYLRLIEDVLRQAGKPLIANKIMSRVSEVRPCKESTILMYLTLNERFVRLESGEFALREWLIAEQQTDFESTSHLTTSFIEQLKREAMATFWNRQSSLDSEK